MTKSDVLRKYQRALEIDRAYNSKRKDFMQNFNTDIFLSSCTIKELGWIKDHIGERINKVIYG